MCSCFWNLGRRCWFRVFVIFAWGSLGDWNGWKFGFVLNFCLFIFYLFQWFAVFGFGWFPWKELELLPSFFLYFPLDFRPFGSSSSQSRFWLAPKFLSRIWLEFFCLLGCSNDGKHLLRDWSFFWTCNSERSFPPNFGSDVFEVCSFHIFQL